MQAGSGFGDHVKEGTESTIQFVGLPEDCRQPRAFYRHVRDVGDPELVWLGHTQVAFDESPCLRYGQTRPNRSATHGGAAEILHAQQARDRHLRDLIADFPRNCEDA